MNNKVLSNYAKYVSLNVIGMIGISCYILADTFFVSKALGVTGLSALNIAIPAYGVIHGTGLMLGMGGATKYSLYKYQNHNSKANRTFTLTVVIGLLLGLIFTIIGVVFSSPISDLLGANSDTIELTSTYIKTIYSFSVFFIMNNILLAFIRNDNNPKLSMVAMLLGSFSNVILDYVFMFPLSMGMFGAAFATGLAPIISICILFIHVLKKKNKFHLSKFKFKVKKVASIFSLGISSFINELSTGIVVAVFNLMILGITGNVGVAAYGVIANIALVVNAIFTGIAQGIQPLCSKYYGQADNNSLKIVLKYSIILSVSLAIIIYALLNMFPENIINVFNSENNQELLLIAKTGILVYFIGFLFAGINIVASSFLSSVESPKASFVVSMTKGLVAILPLIILLGKILGMFGVWLAFPIAEFITIIIAVVLLLRQKNKI